MIINGFEPEVESPVSLIAENIDLDRFLSSEDGGAIVVGQGLPDFLNVTIGDRITLLDRQMDESMRQ